MLFYVSRKLFANVTISDVERSVDEKTLARNEKESIHDAAAITSGHVGEYERTLANKGGKLSHTQFVSLIHANYNEQIGRIREKHANELKELNERLAQRESEHQERLLEERSRLAEPDELQALRETKSNYIQLTTSNRWEKFVQGLCTPIITIGGVIISYNSDKGYWFGVGCCMVILAAAIQLFCFLFSIFGLQKKQTALNDSEASANPN